MNGAVIKEFLVGLGFQVDEQGLKTFEAGIKSATLSVAAIGAATIAAAGAVMAGVQKIAGEYDQLDKLATQFRDSADAIDEFIDASEILGISGDVAKQSLKEFDRAIIDTSMGMGRAQKVFEELGLSVKDAGGNLKPTTQVIAELQEKMQGMERGKQMRIMERLGLDPALLKLFNADMGKLRAEMEAIDKAADFDFDTAIAESKAFMAVWKKIQQEVEKWKMLFGKAMESIAVKLMPGLRTSMKRALEGMERFRRMVMDAMPSIIGNLTPVIQVIMRIAEAFIIIVARIAQGAGAIIGWFAKLNDATNGWAGYILLAAAAWKYLNLAFLKTPLGMLLSLAALVALLIDDFLTFKEGGESLIDWGSGFGIVMQVVTSILTGLLAGILAVKGAMLAKAAVIAFAQGVMAIYTGAVAAFNGVMTVMRGVILGAKAVMALFNGVMLANPIGLVIAAIAALIGIGYLLISNWDTVKEWFVGLFNWFAETFPGITGFVSDAFKGAADAAIGIFTGVKDWFMGFFNWILEKFETIKNIAGAVTGFASSATEKASGAVSNAWGSVKGFFGGGSKDAENANPRPPSLAPSPQAAAAVTGGQQNVNQQTQIVVQGAGSPDATARAVAGQQNRVNADMARNMKGAAR